MALHIALSHRTHYRYDRPVGLSPQIIRLRPAPHCRTPILSYSLRIQPEPHFLNWQQDPQGNWLARVVFPEKTRELSIEVNLTADMVVINPFDFFLEPSAEQFPFVYDDDLLNELAPFRQVEPAGPRLQAWLDSVARTPVSSVAFLMQLNQRLQQDIRYLIRLEPGVQTPEETLQKGSGSCRDSAWLLVHVLRHLGLAARFVSGYLVQLEPDVKALDGPAGTSADFTDLHAWTEVYLPGAGWVGLDPTSGLMAGEGHIPLACTPEPAAAAPLSGYSEKCQSTFEHHMQVERVFESPRVTRPYTEEQWQRLLRLGQAIDAELDLLDVRLTMGGEPTFVSVDDRNGAEWNTSALGPHKRPLASRLLHRLRDRYAPYGLLHYGQGKWYPGEQLPRWALGVFWRVDEQPLWHDPALLADETLDYGFDTADAERFARSLCQRLGVPDDFVMPAYEDAWYYLWRERNLPVNVDPHDSRLSDEQERARLARIFDRGLETVSGYVLPLAARASGEGWQSGPWFLRAERLYLLPGDSPIGFRLPLDSQPWVDASDYPWDYPADPSVKPPPLPSAAALQQRLAGAGSQARLHMQTAQTVVAPARGESATGITRTALCVEARNGCLYVFMPPLSRLEAYVELLACIEATAAAEQLPLLIEGYEPPRDARLQCVKVTPDPGVIEVNVQPASRWSELVEHTEFLYDAAHQTRLTTEKFMLDGRHVGTGGGNHLVLGGATPEDSPFLRRPDLLRSLISWWINHPSLSYLFSGLFIGPTSQAPRVDEARTDSLYELERAFAQFPSMDRECPPWLVDRLLRHLLIDSSGNTHRSEFCIDKLFSPDSASGRLGLLELRAFEMPPHARMSLAQQLLLRGLIAHFWQHPYHPQRLQRWGTQLHDRFMLPHFVQQDFADVLQHLRDAGYAFEDAWFAPHLEFRFPVHGEHSVAGLHLELRHALEPWHVLGEEAGAGGTVRYVDASLERVQLKVRGMVDDRHMVTCNGRPVPLHPTGVHGEYVAGVRFRAWQPPNGLHPTIGVQAPLVFDVVDRWLQRSLGGFSYHVAHPGGRNYQDFPVNAYEAEGRRLARFSTVQHTPGRLQVEAVRLNPEFPFTLDLRY